MAFLVMEVDAQQTADVDTGTGVPSRVEANVIASQWSQEDQRFPEGVWEECM